MHGSVTNLPNRLSDADFDREWSALVERFGGDSRQKAGTTFDQEAAKLLAKSGWTQEKIARKIGKDRSWVSYHLTFGGFLDFVTTVTTNEKDTSKLSEWAFRKLYLQTTTNPNPLARFKDVLDLLDGKKVARNKQRPSIAKDIVDHFADGRFHNPRKIAEKLDVEIDHVTDTFANMTKEAGTAGAIADSKKVGHETVYRITRKGRLIDSNEISRDLRPIVDAMKDEMKKHRVNYSPMSFQAYLVNLERLLDSWVKGEPYKPALLTEDLRNDV